jgi:hypothetical protein
MRIIAKYFIDAKPQAPLLLMSEYDFEKKSAFCKFYEKLVTVSNILFLAENRKRD